MEENKDKAQEKQPIVVPPKNAEPDGNKETAAKAEPSDAKPEGKQV